MKVIDFFCGMGGASLGYKNSGNEVILAIDKWEDALQTHSHNIKETPVINCDINELDLGSLPDVPGVVDSGACFDFTDFSDFSAAAFSLFTEVEIFGVTVISSRDRLFELEDIPFFAIIYSFLLCYFFINSTLLYII